MTECLCGCGEKVGVIRRGFNKFGDKTVSLNERIAGALSLLQEPEPRHDGDVRPTIARLTQDANDGAYYSDFWARAVHGETQDPAEFRDTRRDWYEWTKAAARMTALVELPPEELRGIVHANRAQQARA